MPNIKQKLWRKAPLPKQVQRQQKVGLGNQARSFVVLVTPDGAEKAIADLVQRCQKSGYPIAFIFCYQDQADIDNSNPFLRARYTASEPIRQRLGIWGQGATVIADGIEICYNYNYTFLRGSYLQNVTHTEKGGEHHER